MAISEQDLIEFASDTAKSGASEVEIRASISRAYYAAFHSLAPFASRLPKSRVCPVGLDRVNHHELKERLREWDTDGVAPGLARLTATKSTLWRAIDAACKARVVADYRMGYEVSLAEAQTQVARVKTILRHAQQIQAEISRGDDKHATADQVG